MPATPKSPTAQDSQPKSPTSQDSQDSQAANTQAANSQVANTQAANSKAAKPTVTPMDWAKPSKRKANDSDQDSDQDDTKACKPLTGVARKRHYESPLQSEARAFGLDVDTHCLNAELLATLQTPHFDKRTAIDQLRALLEALETATSTAIQKDSHASPCPVEQVELVVLRALLKTTTRNACLAKTVQKLAVQAIRKHTDEIKSVIDAISNAETIPDLEDIEDVRQHNKKIRLALNDMLV